MSKISDLINWAKVNIPSNLIVDFYHLASFYIGIKKSFIFSRKEEVFDSKIFDKIKEKSKELINGKPVEYITGICEFCGLDILIDDQKVLIPRPETEELVYMCFDYIKNKNVKTILDLCSGSGCISSAIKNRFKDIDVFASDVCQYAYENSVNNYNRLNLSVNAKKGSWFEPWNGYKFDIIVSNPPYLSNSEWDFVDKSVRLFEPKIALISGESGFEAYEIIASEARNFLSSNGAIFLEIGHLQSDYLLDMFSKKGWKNIEIFKDINGKKRFLFSALCF